MIKTLTRSDRGACAGLFAEMFRARAAVFHDRLGWNVRVRDGLEIDRCDEDEDPVYLVSLDRDGTPTGSLRLLPTIGETMLHNEFAKFFDTPPDVQSPTTWECTRFCVHPRGASQGGAGARRVSSELLIGLCDHALSRGIEQIVGLYDAHMTRVYRRIGWSPAPLALVRPDIGKLVLGIWSVTNGALAAMRTRTDDPANPGFSKQAA